MKLTVVSLVAVSLVGMTLAAGAARGQSAPGPLVPRPVMFDDQVVPTGCGCGPRQEMEPSCGCDAGPSCGCQSCGCESCGGCGCDDCCDDGCGLLNGCDVLCGCGQLGVRFRAEFLPMTRTVSNETHDIGLGAFNSNDFNFTYEWGVRAAAEIRVGCDCSAEVLYMGQQRWNDEIINANGDTATYDSELFGGEVNFWCPLPLHCCKLSAAYMFGARYFDLREEATFTPVGGATALIETQNRIVAGQLGWMINLDLGHRFSLRSEGRGGLGPNLAERDTIAPAINLGRKQNNVAFIGDTSLVLNFQATQHFSAYAGYFVMYADGLALAAQQFDVNPLDINHEGAVFFQAGMAGVEVTW